MADINWGDLASKYADARFGPLSQMFTDPGTALTNRLYGDLGVPSPTANTANATPVTQTIKTDNEGNTTVSTTGAPQDVTAAHAPIVGAAIPQTPLMPTALPAVGAAPTMVNLANSAQLMNGQPNPNYLPSTPQSQAEAKGLSAPVAPTAPTEPGVTGAAPAISTALPNQVNLLNSNRLMNGTPNAPTPEPPNNPILPTTTANTALGSGLANAFDLNPALALAPPAFKNPVDHHMGIIADAANTNKVGMLATAAEHPGVSDPQQRIAADVMAQKVTAAQEAKKAEQAVNSAVQTGDIKTLNQIMNERNADKGSYLKAYLFKRFGLDDLAKQEQQKLGDFDTWKVITNPVTQESALVKFTPEGLPTQGWSGKTGDRLEGADLISAAGASGIKGMATGQTMGFDRAGNVISHSINKATGQVLWKNETTGQTLSGAPEGYHMGQDPLEMRIIQGKKQIINTASQLNAKSMAATGQPALSQAEINQQIDAFENQMRGISTPTAPTAAAAERAAPTTTTATTPSSTEGLQLTAEQDALARQGVPIISGIRTAQQQEALKDHRGPNGEWLTKEGRPVAVNSKHLSGDAIDVNPRKMTGQLEETLIDSGWRRPDPVRDPNHWEKLTPTAATTSAATASPGANKRASLDQTALEIYEGRQAMPTGMGANNLENKYIRDKVQQIAAQRGEPFDANRFKLNQQVITKDYAPSGTQGKNIIALNTAIGHLATIEEKARGLNNSDTHAVNAWSQEIGKNFNQPNVTSFNALKPILAGEIGKTITSTGGTLAERQEAEHAINSANTPAEMTANLKTLKEALASKLTALKLPYESAGGKDFDKKFLLPQTQKEMAKLKTGGHVPTTAEIAAERERRKQQQGQ